MHHGRSLIYWFKHFIQSHVQMCANMIPALLECLNVFATVEPVLLNTVQLNYCRSNHIYQRA